MEDTFYDTIILGTGLPECIISLHTKKTLQIDSHRSYGSDTRTLCYSDLCKTFNQTPKEELLKLDKQFNIDLTPKFILASSKIIELLKAQNLLEIIDFVTVDGAFIYTNSLHLVPYNEKSTLKSGLISWLQKPFLANFFWKVRKFCEKKSLTFKNDMTEEFKSFGLNEKSIDLVGHAIALNLNEEYLRKKPEETYANIEMYIRSLLTLEGKSPFLYPVYGLSELSQGFARRGGMKGVVFMLDTEVLQIEDNQGNIIETKEEYADEIQKLNLEIISGLKSNKNTTEYENNSSKIDDDLNSGLERLMKDNTPPYIYKLTIKNNTSNITTNLYTNQIIAHPSFFPSHTKKIYEINTCICIVKGPIKLSSGSSHILFLAKDLKRKNDVFLAILGNKENVCPEGYNIAIISTKKENNEDKIFDEIVKKLGETVFRVNFVRDFCEGVKIGNISVFGSVDETTHFESMYREIEKMIKNIEK